MTTELTTMPNEQATLVAEMAQGAGLDSRRYFETIKQMCGCKKATTETFYALLIQAKRLDLDPLAKQLYMIDTSHGPRLVIPIDGYLRIMLRHPRYVSHTVIETNDSNGNAVSATIKIFTKEQVGAGLPPFEHTEYMSECKGNSGPWRSHPRRMLKHKVVSQGVRYCFGAYLPDEDEWKRAAEVEGGALPDKSVSGLAGLTATLRETDEPIAVEATVTAEVPYDANASRALDAEVANEMSDEEVRDLFPD